MRRRVNKHNPRDDNNKFGWDRGEWFVSDTASDESVLELARENQRHIDEALSKRQENGQ